MHRQLTSILCALTLASTLLTRSVVFAQTPGVAPRPVASPLRPARRPYRLYPTLDLAVLATGATLWFGPDNALAEIVRVNRCPCDPSILNSLDRSTAGVSVANSTVPSNIVAGVLLSLPALIDGADVWRSGGTFTEWFEDTIVLGEALLLGGAINGMAKLLYQRPRPSAYGADPDDPRFADPNTYLSFYSLSASELFTAAVVGSTTYALRHPHGAMRWVYLATSETLAVGFGISRVLTGKHFPTDVFAAAAVGSLIGVVVPLLHERPLPVMLGGTVTQGAAVITATVTTP
jgi:membrane-associated phospholipid phosphatase